jgi:hypothetical protein
LTLALEAWSIAFYRGWSVSARWLRTSESNRHSMADTPSVNGFQYSVTHGA